MTDIALPPGLERIEAPEVDASTLDALETHPLLRLARWNASIPFVIGTGALGFAAYVVSDGSAVVGAVAVASVALLLARVVASDARVLRRGSREFDELVRLARRHPRVRQYLRLRADREARGCHLRVARRLARRDVRAAPAAGEFRRSELIDARGV